MKLVCIIIGFNIVQVQNILLTDSESEFLDFSFI